MNKVQREKLLFALQLHDMVGGINSILAEHQAYLRIDYINGITPFLMLGCIGTQPEPLGFLDTRKRFFYRKFPTSPGLFKIAAKIQGLMSDFDASLVLTSKQPKQGKRIALLQVQISHASAVSLTLMGVAKGKSISDNVFQLPDSETP